MFRSDTYAKKDDYLYTIVNHWILYTLYNGYAHNVKVIGTTVNCIIITVLDCGPTSHSQMCVHLQQSSNESAVFVYV